MYKMFLHTPGSLASVSSAEEETGRRRTWLVLAVNLHVFAFIQLKCLVLIMYKMFLCTPGSLAGLSLAEGETGRPGSWLVLVITHALDLGFNAKLSPTRLVGIEGGWGEGGTST